MGYLRAVGTDVINETVLLTESFESGKLDSSWKAEGFVEVVDSSDLSPYWLPEEGHTGKYVALLGAYSNYHGPFSLQRKIPVTPGADLTVTFWYRGWFAFGHPYSFPLQMVLSFSIVSSEFGTLDQVTVHGDGITETWQSITRSVSVPASCTGILLRYSGQGAYYGERNFGRGYYGGVELDDISVVERTLRVTQTLVQTTSASAPYDWYTQNRVETESSEATRSLPSESGFLQTTWPYLAVIFAMAVSLLVVLLAGRRTTSQAGAAGANRLFCSQCGFANPLSNDFCGKCGQKLERVV